MQGSRRLEKGRLEIVSVYSWGKGGLDGGGGFELFGDISDGKVNW